MSRTRTTTAVIAAVIAASGALAIPRTGVTASPPDAPTGLASVAFGDATTGWAGGGLHSVAASVVLRSLDGGQSWASVAVPGSPVVYSVGAFGHFDAFVGTATDIMATHDGGNTWQGAGLASTQPIRAFSSPDGVHGWAAGGGSGGSPVLVATVDGGRHWSSQASALPVGIDHLTSVSFSDALHGTAAGVAPVNAQLQALPAVDTTSDGGGHWSAVAPPPASLGAAMVKQVDTAHLWLGANGGLWASSDGGQHWTGPAAGTSSLTVTSVDMVDTQHGWATAALSAPPLTRALLATTDGATWTTQTLPAAQQSVVAVSARSTTRALAVGMTLCLDPSIIATSDGGTSWSEALGFPAPETVTAGSLGGASNPRFTAVDGCARPSALRSDNGAAWSSATVDNTLTGGRGLAFASALAGWFVGDQSVIGGVQQGWIEATSNGGASWSAQQVPSTPSAIRELAGVAMVNASNGWAVGFRADGQAGILKTTDGVTWSEQTVSSPNSGGQLQAVSAPDATHAWAVGTATVSPAGIVEKTADGLTWTQSSLPSGDTYPRAIRFFDGTHGLVAGSTVQGAAFVLTTADAGTSWIAPPAAPALLGSVGTVTLSAPSATNWVVSDGTVVTMTSDAGSHWSTPTTPPGMLRINALAFTDSLNGWVGGSEACGALIERTVDGGAHWTLEDSTCPIAAATPITIPAPPGPPQPPPPPTGGAGPNGYWLVATDGGIFPFGKAGGFGSTGGIRLNQPIVGMAPTAGANGYWLVASDGGIFPFGDALQHSYGSTGGIHLNQPIVGMAPTASGNGYWLVASDGGIFPFGDALQHSYGSTGGIHLNQAILGMAPTASGDGYWLVATDGGIFPFGDAVQHSYGSTGAIHLNQPIVGMARTAGGNGYWLVASDGGIFPFGDALQHSYGSTGGMRLNKPIVGMAASPDGNGYWLVATDGGIFPFGPSAVGFGSLGATPLNAPIVGMTAF